MNPDPSQSPNPGQGLPIRRGLKIYLPILLAALALAGILWVVLRILTRSPNLSAEMRLALLLLAALLSLWASLGGLTLLLKRRGRSLSEIISIPVILLLAYLVPALAFVLPDWISPGLKSLDIQTASLAAAGQPWFFLWQALVLAGSALLPQPAVKSSPVKSSRALLWRVAASLLAGLGAWLAGAFVYGLFASAYPLQPEPPSPVVQAAVLVVGVLVAPWAEERFFRSRILGAWEPRIGRTKAVILSAALFAFLQMRPLLWLPAFIVGLVLAELYLQTRRLACPILAHALCNLLFFLMGWYLMI